MIIPPRERIRAAAYEFLLHRNEQCSAQFSVFQIEYQDDKRLASPKIRLPVMTTETWSLMLWLIFGFIGFYLLTQLIDFVRWWVASRKKIN